VDDHAHFEKTFTTLSAPIKRVINVRLNSIRLGKLCMNASTHICLMLLVGVGLLFFIAVFSAGPMEKRAGSLLIYGRSLPQRTGSFLIAILALLATLLGYPFNKYATGSHLWSWLALLLINLVGSAAVLFFAGPRDITIDTKQKMYVARFGWPLSYRKWHGPVDDVAGVRVYGNAYKSKSILSLVWKREGPPNIVLGIYPSLKRAEAAAHRISTSMDVPVL
jgi:hypothetical protein